ncbi:hypothetical protein [Streptococcus merionis]|uniref:hypothetical protein n=1 Tax=Streptococcus merionis TaxID=400065 RepID=UPI00351382B2
MEQFCIGLAGLVIRVTCRFASTRVFCKDYLTDDEPDFEINVEQKDIDFERVRGGEKARHFSGNYLEQIALYRLICEVLPAYDRLLIHGSAIVLDGQAYLFTAPSGTGKSTHSQLWLKVFGDRARILNDDKPLLHITGEQILIYGTPWDGKHSRSYNGSAPLEAICFLNQGLENAAIRLSETVAFDALVTQTYRPLQSIDQLKKTLALLQKVSHLPTYQLTCTISTEAVDVIYEKMTHKNHSNKINNNEEK